MALALMIFGVAFGAFCVWLTVRIINRRERWAKWMLAAAIGAPTLYLACFGPVCRMHSKGALSFEQIEFAYRPVMWSITSGPQMFGRIAWNYADLWGGEYTLQVLIHKEAMKKIDSR